MMSPHVKRVLTSLLLLPLLGWAIYSGDPVLGLGVTAVAGLGLMEFYAMFWPGREKPVWKALGLLLALGMVWAPLDWSGTALVCLAMLGAATAFLLAHDRAKSPRHSRTARSFSSACSTCPSSCACSGPCPLRRSPWSS